jgi:cytosine/uracil/thiamine/allantoin permease
VVLTDQYLRRDGLPVGILYDRAYRNHAGVVALVVGIAVSVPLFSNQALFTGLLPRLVPGVGDATFLVGFVLAGAVYALLFPRVAAHAAAPAE